MSCVDGKARENLMMFGRGTQIMLIFDAWLCHDIESTQAVLEVFLLVQTCEHVDTRGRCWV